MLCANRWRSFKKSKHYKIKRMTLKELGEKLNEMYNNAPKGSSVVMIHLFGIKYAKEIKASNFSQKDIIKQSGISTSYFAELNKGVKLAKFVVIKNKLK
jgi:hypothetical protein